MNQLNNRSSKVIYPNDDLSFLNKGAKVEAKGIVPAILVARPIFLAN